MSRRKRYRAFAFAVVYGAGILAQLAMLYTVFWWGITGTLSQHIMAIIIMVAQSILLIRSGGWWLHTAAKMARTELLRR